MSALPTDAALPDDFNYEDYVTEDHKPADGIFVEKQYRLLIEPLYANWTRTGAEKDFLVLANVGWFYKLKTPAVVPDCLLSLGVTCPENLQEKAGHSYYQWDMGKPPDVVIEIVSDRVGGEESSKKRLYARLAVAYSAVQDPKHFLSDDTLRTYVLCAGAYQLGEPGPWPTIGLGLRLWQGRFEGAEACWLRWCDANGAIIPTGAERARELEAELRRLKGEPPAATS